MVSTEKLLAEQPNFYEIEVIEKPFNEVAIVEEQSISVIESAAEPDVCPSTERIGKLLAELSFFYTDRMTKKLEYDMPLLIKAWQTCLAGVTDEMVDRGLKKWLDPYEDFRKFPPDAADFAAVCLPTPKEIGIPSAMEAFNDYKNHEIESIKRTYYKVGYSKFQWHEQQVWRVWEDEYEKVVKELMHEHHKKLKDGSI